MFKTPVKLSFLCYKEGGGQICVASFVNDPLVVLSKNLVRSKKVPVMAFQKKKFCQPSLSMVNLCLHSYTFYLLIYPFLPVWSRFHITDP